MDAGTSDETRRYLVAGLGGLAVALAASAAFLFYESSLRRAVAPHPPAASGPTAPDFDYPRLDGTRVRLSGLRGRVVLVDFWATWCPPCRAEMPFLVQTAKRLEGRGVSLVAISEDDPPAQEPEVTGFARQTPGLDRFAVLGDPDVERRYGVQSMPTLFIVDRAGRVAASFVGRGSEAEVLAALEKVLTPAAE